LTLLEPRVTQIGEPDGPGTDDRLDDGVAAGTPRELRDALANLIGEEQVHGRAIDLVRYASDASPYRLAPQVVVTPRDVADVVAILKFCRESGRHATFRAAGTSLNGQSQGDGVLIDVRRHWYGMSIEDDGGALRGRPGTILGHAARFLEMHGRRLGPDPASIDACTIGGVVANNAGGMRCRLDRNAYSTVRSMTFVLASGTVIDTAAPDAEDRVPVELAPGARRNRRARRQHDRHAHPLRHGRERRHCGHPGLPRNIALGAGNLGHDRVRRAPEDKEKADLPKPVRGTALPIMIAAGMLG
jgi:hypothetical protein